MTQQARIGIIGAGFWSSYFYLPYLRDAPDAVCVGVVRRNEEALAALKRGFDLDVASTEVEDLLAAGCAASSWRPVTRCTASTRSLRSRPAATFDREADDGHTG